MQDLIDFLEDTYTPEEIIEMLDGIDKNKIEEYATSRGICVKCGYELILHTWKEERGEYIGSPAEETMAVYQCSGCGKIYE